MPELGKLLVGIGLVIAAVGLFLWKVGGRSPLGRLPGDILIEKGTSTFYFPLMTCIVISVVLTLVMWLVRR